MNKRNSRMLWMGGDYSKDLVDFNLEKKLFFLLHFLFNRGFSVWNNELFGFPMVVCQVEHQ